MITEKKKDVNRQEENSMKKLTAIVAGFGMRGNTYSQYAADHPDQIEIVAVAEPREVRKQEARKLLGISDENIYDDWKQLAQLPKMADFAIITMQDDMHYEPALEFIEKGYNLLLEKPMAITAEHCKGIAEAAEKKGVKVIVCHVLRFTHFWYKLKDIIDNGDIGEIMSIIHMENVGNLHQSHSYVRGNWRSTRESAPMILAKSCHDLDILQWLIGKECKKVQSFGSLKHFVAENKPDGAPDYCMQGCPAEAECVYHAKKVYYDDKETWFRNPLTGLNEPTDEAVMKAITDGPYGRCVYSCDNDVVDHQVVNMEFEGGCTVSFTMNAFNKGGRFIRIFGTKGEIVAGMDDNVIDVYSFDTREHTLYELDKIGQEIDSGHGGGDTGIMIDLVKYFNDEQPSKSVCSIRTSYMNHLIGFAAEESRYNNTVVDLQEFSDKI